MQAILKAHDPQSDRTMLQIRIARFFHRVIIDVDDVIEHPHGGRDRLFQLGVIEPASTLAGVMHVIDEIHRAQIAHRDFAFVGVQRDLGAEVRRMHDTDMILRRANVAWVFERDPRMPGFKQHRQHLPPECQRRDCLEQLHFAARGLGFIAGVCLFKGLAKFVVQVRAIAR